ncbi:MAG: 30S ribosomal protein S4 [Nitrospirae bacterium]|nr:30S ribosomal protein S4 [Nitrospirota bacterium]
MGRYIGSVCRLCRREGTKLFLKGTRCYTEKCAVERRAYPPGQHGQGRPRISEYNTQLREKQKLRRMYGLLERQFSGYFHKAARKKGVTTDYLLQFLEGRLDNVVYRICFSSSRKEARQLVDHGHILVNGRKVNIPSCQVKEGDTIEVKEKSRGIVPIQKALEGLDTRGLPSWLELNRTTMQGRVRAIPVADEIELPVNVQMVVELYSR